MTERLYRRRRIFVSRIQRKFVLVIIVVLLLMFCFVEWDIYKTTKDISFTIPSLSVESIGEMVKSTYNLMMIKIFVLMLVLSLLGIWLSIYLSHKVVGPLYRLEDEIKTIIGIKGDLTHTFKIRTKDEIGNLIEAMNLMIAKLREKMKENNVLKDEIKTEINKEISLIKEKETISGDEKNRLISHLENLIEKLENSLSDTEFKLEK